MWRKTTSSMMYLEEPSAHGWNKDRSIDWVSEPYPQDVIDLLKNDESDDNSDSDNEDDYIYDENEESSEFEQE